MKIEWLISASAPQWLEDNYENGGYVYDTYARHILRETHEVTVTYISRGSSKSKIKRILQMSKYIQQTRNLKLQGDIVCRDLFSTVFAPFDKNRKHIVILHHLDTSGFNNKRFYQYFNRKYYQKILLADVVVVVSEYWKEIVSKAGCKNIEIIYNAYDLTQFEFNDNELTDFRKNLGLPNNKPIIYLGNAQQAKGYIESYHALKDIDAIFITTGKNNIELPILHLYLSYSDYLKLLKISSLVITMSKFNEGWCRTAHEAMLCGTPVVGSGKGGMKEVLEKGGQIICGDFNKLRDVVTYLLENKTLYKENACKGKKYAGQFTFNKFRNNWIQLISSMM